MNSLATRRCSGASVSADIFFTLPDDGNRYELIDGELVMSPSAIYGHNAVLLFVAAKMQHHAEARRLGRVNIETDVRLADDLVVRPDIHFIGSRRMSIVQRYVYGPPDLAVEITSPDNRSMDVFTKRRVYEEHGVKEYWILDIARLPCTAYQWTLRGGEYKGGPITAAILRSNAIKGFTLRLADVWDRAYA